ncbi:MAG: FitA-like ribbon-helix-helix domain-containing protein [Solirubrobacteraceae bacterium]
MSHLQLKDIPDGVHAALRARARRSGVSMREYVLRLIEQDLDRRDTQQEMIARLQALPKASDRPDVVALIHGAREEREAQLLRAVGR